MFCSGIDRCLKKEQLNASRLEVINESGVVLAVDTPQDLRLTEMDTVVNP